MTACMYVLAWLSIIVTYLIKIGKTVGILTQTLVLSPESVTSSYFPKLLQIHDIQCTEQRRDTCYRHTPDLCQPQTKLNNGSGHEPDAAKCDWEGEGWGCRGTAHFGEDRLLQARLCCNSSPRSAFYLLSYMKIHSWGKISSELRRFSKENHWNW